MNTYVVTQEFGHSFDVKADSYAIGESGALIFYGPTKSSSREQIFAVRGDSWLSVSLVDE